MRTQIKNFFLNNKGFLALLLILFSFRSSFIDWNLVPSGSMLPTIQIGDVVLVNKAAYNIRVPFTKIELLKTGDFKRGDIVIFDSEKSGKRMIKRLIGLPNDIVKMKDNQLYINGQKIERSLLKENELSKVFIEKNNNHTYQTNFNKDSENESYSNFEVKIPEDSFLVLGDNRNNSADSRFYGLIPRNEIVGRSDTVILSFNSDKYYIPRINRFFFNYNKVD